MVNNSQEVTKNKETISNKNIFRYNHSDNKKPMGTSLYLFIPLGIGISCMEGMANKIFGTTMIIGGYTGMCIDGYTPLKIIEGIGALTCLPYDLTKYAVKKYYQRHKKIKRAKNIKAIRTSKLESCLSIT